MTTTVFLNQKRDSSITLGLIHVKSGKRSKKPETEITTTCVYWLKVTSYADDPVASFGIKNKKAIGIKLQINCMETPRRRLSKEPEEMFKSEANPAPTKEPNVDPRLLIDMKSANRVPSIPGGHSCPDKIKNGMNLQSQ